MSLIQHPGTGFEIGDPQKIPLTQKEAPSRESVLESAQSLILSASGWRKVFAWPAANDAYAPWSAGKSVIRAGDAHTKAPADNSLSPRISPEDRVICALMAKTFGDFILERKNAAPARQGAVKSQPGGAQGKEPDMQPAIILGIDSRPTGPAMADVFARVLLGMGIEVHYCFIIAAPEIMAFAATSGALPPDDDRHADGFVYLSASHNPPGHNGVKFGLVSGGVLSPAEVSPLITTLKAFLGREDCVSLALSLIGAAKPQQLTKCYISVSSWKRQAVSAYTLFTHEVITAEHELADQAKFLDTLAAECEKRPLGIVGELNGSARSTSIDEDFLAGLGIKTSFINDSPRAFAHRIVPEGSSLSLCALKLQEARKLDQCFELGYVPDCDGDRGNLVYYDRRAQKARALEAQEVFALSCVAELATLALSGRGSAPGANGTAAAGKTAIVVNDATSMRIERIAAQFGASVFRAETGEANVVNLAEQLRSKGWTVRILGEGSNGGNITHPAKVRDPLSTVGAMIKLLRFTDSTGQNLFRIWLESCSQEEPYRPDYDLSDIIDTLPLWSTTSVFEERAALRVKAGDHAKLKTAYRDIFLREWEQRKDELRNRFGIETWRALATNGSHEKEIGDDFALSGTGGLRIVFSAARGIRVQDKAFLWLRGSGTEPVFRIMADIDGGTHKDEAYLLDWHTRMVRAADS
ncbi:MAG: hypothetical protein LLF89_09630 [Spirochaetaceae bacterium]|nr:hypothetical protein [Spirochaetaceae bacterium]